MFADIGVRVEQEGDHVGGQKHAGRLVPAARAVKPTISRAPRMATWLSRGDTQGVSVFTRKKYNAEA